MGSDRLAADDAIQVLYLLCYGYTVVSCAACACSLSTRGMRTITCVLYTLLAGLYLL